MKTAATVRCSCRELPPCSGSLRYLSTGLRVAAYAIPRRSSLRYPSTGLRVAAAWQPTLYQYRTSCSSGVAAYAISVPDYAISVPDFA
eukprot:3244470-Rhodomonas_salina.2